MGQPTILLSKLLHFLSLLLQQITQEYPLILGLVGREFASQLLEVQVERLDHLSILLLSLEQISVLIPHIRGFQNRLEPLLLLLIECKVRLQELFEEYLIGTHQGLDPLLGLGSKLIGAIVRADFLGEVAEDLVEMFEVVYALRHNSSGLFVAFGLDKFVQALFVLQKNSESRLNGGEH